VDLHVHSTHSDGAYAPAQIVDLAARCGLAAVAISDHDTTTGVAPARAAARPGLEVIPAVEITAELDGHDLHLLGYFIAPDHGPLIDALERLRDQRADRFYHMLDRLRQRGLSFGEDEVRAAGNGGTMGRRNLAMLLVQTGRCASIGEAFARYLNHKSEVVLPAPRLAAAEAIALICAAGGVAAWAHPSYDSIQVRLASLQRLGLQAIEVDYPTHRPTRVRDLRALAAQAGLAVTGGSDCHGPDNPRRAIGARGITRAELDLLRQRAAAMR
jgi:hypothetical protein